jgi:hypothetical protein
MMSVLGARARCSGEIWCSVLALVLGKIEVLSARFFKVLSHLARIIASKSLCKNSNFPKNNSQNF